MLLDTNLLIHYIRRGHKLPARLFLSVVVAGELEAFALKSAWGPQKLQALQGMRERFAVIEINEQLLPAYARIDAYSQGKLLSQPLPPGLTARNMGKNDLWIAATALYFDIELHTTDNDFDHLRAIGLQLVKS